MRKLIENIQTQLVGFIEQRNDVALVVRCADAESAHILKILQAHDQGTSPDYFWMFSLPFTGAQNYAEAIIEQFTERHDGVRTLMQEAGMPPWPEVPAPILDTHRPPLERLREAMMFSRSLLPSPEGHLAVWVLFPLQIEDAHGYAAFMRELLQHDVDDPWCHHLRFIVRDDKAAPALASFVEQTSRIDTYEPDLNNEAVTKSFEDEANDEHTPLPLRMQALLVLAGMDYSHRHYEEALQKYGLLHRYYEATGNKPLQALTLNGIGEVYGRMDQNQAAQQHFEAALAPAIEAESKPVLLNISLNLGNLMLKQEQWDEAETYYAAAEKLATAQLLATTKIQCLENIGICRVQQRRYGEAVASWNEAATLARTLDEPALLKPVLQRLEDLYRQGRMHKEQQEIAQEIATLAA